MLSQARSTGQPFLISSRSLANTLLTLRLMQQNQSSATATSLITSHLIMLIAQHLLAAPLKQFMCTGMQLLQVQAAVYQVQAVA